MRKAKKNPHWGSTLDDFLDEQGIREAAKTEAVTRVVVCQLREEIKRQGISKARLAEEMKTSRAQIDRVLKAKGNVTIETLQRAAELVGRRLRLELVRRGLVSRRLNASKKKNRSHSHGRGGWPRLAHNLKVVGSNPTPQPSKS